MRSGNGIGRTGRVGLPWGSDGSLILVSSDDRARAAPRGAGTQEPPGRPGGSWSAMKVDRGALDTRPAQGRVGAGSRHGRHLATALPLLAARASEPSDAARRPAP